MKRVRSFGLWLGLLGCVGLVFSVLLGIVKVTAAIGPSMPKIFGNIIAEAQAQNKAMATADKIDRATEDDSKKPRTLTEPEKWTIEAVLSGNQTLMSTLTWATAVVSGILIVLAVGLSVILGGSVREANAENKSDLEAAIRQLDERMQGKVLSIVAQQASVGDKTLTQLVTLAKDADEQVANWKKRTLEYENLGVLGDMVNNIRANVEDEDYDGAYIILEKIERDADESGLELAAIAQSERIKALVAARKLLKGAEKNKVAPNILYNGAAIAGRLKLGSIEQQMLESATKLNPGSAVYAARLIRHKVSHNPAAVPEPFVLLTNLIRRQGGPSCELIYSEAWNVAEATRNYSLLAVVSG